MKTLRLFIFSFGLLLGGLSFVSTGAQDSAPAPANVEEHDTKDLEQLLKRYNTDAEKVINDNNKLQETDASKSEVTDSDIDEIRPEDQFEKAAATFAKKKAKVEEPVTTGKFSDDIRIPLSRLQQLSEEDLLKLLKENSRDSKLGPYLDQFPKFTLFTVRLIKDKEAIPSVVKIVENKDKLIWFAGVMISTFLLGFLLERIMRKEGRSILGSIGLYMVRVLIMTVVRFVILMYFYSAEITPALNVGKKIFL